MKWENDVLHRYSMSFLRKKFPMGWITLKKKLPQRFHGRHRQNGVAFFFAFSIRQLANQIFYDIFFRRRLLWIYPIFWKQWDIPSGWKWWNSAVKADVCPQSGSLFWGFRTNHFGAFKNPEKCRIDHRWEKKFLYALPCCQGAYWELDAIPLQAVRPSSTWTATLSAGASQWECAQRKNNNG